ncbi:MAG: hypothetical protein NPIRA05_00120 [Nitrospirales bacterium]|nr:MAG: hypothetical protein NPIRA05_00120 [Nitrospirales bacterium]
MYPSWLAEIGVEDQKISRWCRNNNVTYRVVKSLNSPETVKFVRDSKIDTLIYGGGGILRDELIEAASDHVINPHSGPLPEIRGMNAIEWALLLDEALEVTVHFIDRGIDTGDIIRRVPVKLFPQIQLEELRETAVITAVMEISKLLSEAGDTQSIPRVKQPLTSAGRQCFIMAPAIVAKTRNKLEQLLQSVH